MEGLSLVEAKHESYLQLWRGRVMACRNSGKSVRAWCAENEINIKTYYHWQKMVWDHDKSALIQDNEGSNGPQPQVQFAQINLPPTESSSDVDLVLRKGNWTMEVRNSVNPSILKAVLQVVSCSV